MARHTLRNRRLNPQRPLNWDWPGWRGLVANYAVVPIPGWRGGNTLRDLVRGAKVPHDGTLNGNASWVENALAFDGSTGYVDSSDAFCPVGARTLSCRFCTTRDMNSGSPQYQVLMYYGSTGAGNSCWLFVSSEDNNTSPGVTNRLGISQYADGTGGGPAVNDGLWHHAAVTVSAPSGGVATWTVYLDGEQIAQKTLGTNTLRGGHFRIGRDIGLTSPEYWQGNIGDPCIWNRALSGEEIQALNDQSLRGNPDAYNWLSRTAWFVPSGSLTRGGAPILGSSIVGSQIVRGAA